jgi:Arc/MetJ-type ribon-helix-helix transcriptional regulator
MGTVYWTPRQAEFVEALVDCGYYGTQTEVGRAALEKLIRDLTPHQRREIALKLYEKRQATVSRVAEVADLPLHEARSLLHDAGLLREGSDEPLDERKKKVHTAADKYR